MLFFRLLFRAFFVVLWLFPALVFAQNGRLQLNLNAGWRFHKGVLSDFPASDNKTTTWQQVSLPHTWNTTDVMDDEPGYYRGVGWYRKPLSVQNAWKGKTITLQFGGANQVTEVFVNGKPAGSHTGGYTHFSVDIGELLDLSGGPNEIEVKVDNSHNEDIPPLSADFTFFGGIYRDVDLLVTDPVHISTGMGAPGVTITSAVTAAKADVTVKVALTSSAKKKITLVTNISAADGTVVATKAVPVSLPVKSDTVSLSLTVPTPRLWSPEDPYRYTVTTQLVDANHVVLDEVAQPTGFRWFKFDAETGFTLNGRPYKLIGASRHQDFAGLGNALPAENHDRDIELLKEMGGNFLRVAHYPQDRRVLEACDRLGILASVEIPVVNAITETDAFTANCLAMQREMIRQNINHPSVIVWAYMNEVLLRPRFTAQQEKDRQQQYFGHIRELAQKLENLTRAEDPSRVTMMSCHGDFNRYKQVGLIDIPMLCGWNLYSGWYSGDVTGFATFLDMFHKEYPQKPLLVTEFGADADPRVRSLTPQRFDKSIDYSLNFHRVYLEAITERPFVNAAMIWNLADFNSESREETMPHINNKGLLTWDRRPKDLYRFYKAMLTKAPYIALTDWTERVTIADSTGMTTQPVEVFSTAQEVTLSVDGKTVGQKAVKNGSATFDVPFAAGTHHVTAYAGRAAAPPVSTDNAEFHVEAIGRSFPAGEPVPDMNILLGARRFYIEPPFNRVWIPGQTYAAGGWGAIGGNVYKLAGGGRTGYGTDRDIRGTENDPIYQTQLVGLKGYRFDVPDGTYEVTLHFAELTSSDKVESLAYNLDNSVRKETASDRVFDIGINGQSVFSRFDVAARYGRLTAGYEKVTVLARNGQGVRIDFAPVKGEPVLNAIQLKRMM